MPTRSHIGPYTVVRELGRGGMGVVYLADDPRLGRQVAIKALPDDVAADADRLARLRAEARIVAQLNHPHIAQIHHLVEDDGAIFLVLEYVEGRSLAERINAGLDPQDAIRLMAQVAGALEAAHARHVIHRDLKPDNIRVTQDDTAKILDFGIALGAPTHAPSDQTATLLGAQETVGRIIGTPGYMSPEQCRGLDVDARSDTFSFGCVLYECLTGRHAFSGETVADLVAATLTANPDLSLIPRDLPEGVEQLLRRCLDRDPARRPQSIGEARTALDDALGRRRDTPLPTPDTPTNIPTRLDNFVGRAGELGELDQMLGHARLLTLTGSGGCGKTRLAIELARRTLDRFRAGVWIAELAPTSDDARVPGVVAAAIGVKEQAGSTTTQRIADQIGNAEALLILDNCEHVLDAAGQLAAALLEACHNLRIVTTSREALGVRGEHAWRVPSLGVPDADEHARRAPDPDALRRADAVALFIDRAREVRPGFDLTHDNAEAVASICKRLDGIPLAIELAAARVKMLTPEEIEARLGDRFRLLRAGRGQAERHQTLRAVVDWSYRTLRDDEKEALQRLAVFAGGCTLEAATAVVGGDDADEFEVLDVLTHLADKSLVLVTDDADTTRYRLLETVRQYALEELDRADGTAEARTRHLRYFHAMADKARAERDAGLDRLEADHDNLLEAMANAPSVEGGTRLALQLCAWLFTLWLVRARFSTGRDACALALGLDDAGEHTIERARALNTAGVMAYRLGDLDDAERRYAEALEIARTLDDDHGIAASLGNLGNVANSRRDHAAAIDLYQQSLDIRTRQGDRRSQAIALGNLGWASESLGKLDDARDYAERALDIRRSLDDRRGVALALNNLANIARKQGRLDDARRHLREGLALIRKGQIRDRLASTIDTIAGVAAASDHPEPAARWLGACERLRAETGHARERPNQDEVDELLAALRDRLGDDTLRSSLDAGRDAPIETVLDEAETWLAGA